MAKILSLARVIRTEQLLIDADGVETLGRVEVLQFGDGKYSATTAIWLPESDEGEPAQWASVDPVMDLSDDEESAAQAAYDSLCAMADEALDEPPPASAN